MIDNDQNANGIILRLLELDAIKGSVLEIGCGLGKNVLHISGSGYPALGIDLSGEKISIARQKAQLMLARRGVCARFKQCGLFQLETLSEIFYTIIDSGNLQNMEPGKQRQFLFSMYQILEPDGSAILIIPAGVSNESARIGSNRFSWLEELILPGFNLTSIVDNFKKTSEDDSTNQDTAVILKKKENWNE